MIIWIVFALLLVAFNVLLIIQGVIGMPGSVELAAWVQAIGSVGAIVIAVGLWRLDRHHNIQQQAHQRTEHIRRVVVALRSEIRSALDVAEMRANLITIMKKNRAKAEANDIEVEEGNIQPDSMFITDATIYRAVVQDLGILPIQMLDDIVDFYNDISELHRNIGIYPNTAGVINTLENLMPRIRMLGELLVLKLTKFEQGGFDREMTIKITKKEAETLAKKTGYSLAAALARRAAGT